MTTPANSAAQGGTPAPEVGTPEYNAAMAAAAENVPIQSVSKDGSSVQNVNAPAAGSDTPPTPPANPDRPAWLPEKFQSAEDMAKAYAELERKQSGTNTPPETPPQDPPKNEPNDPPKGVDLGKFQNEFSQAGELSAASYDELAKAGISRETVDAYIAGQVAVQNARTQAGFNEVGGKDQYEEMVNWAKANLSPAEINAFNSQVGGSQEAALLAVRGLNSKYIQSVGKAPSGLLNGGASAGGAASAGFTSRAQVVQAMSDPRYETDSAYRNSVMQRLAVTNDSVI